MSDLLILPGLVLTMYRYQYGKFVPQIGHQIVRIHLCVLLEFTNILVEGVPCTSWYFELSRLEYDCIECVVTEYGDCACRSELECVGCL